MTVTRPLLARPLISSGQAPGGSLILRSDQPRGPMRPASACCCGAGRARHQSASSWLSAGEDRGWATLSFVEASRRADAVAQALLDRGLGVDRPVVLLSGNSLDHALLMLGGLVAGLEDPTPSP